MGSARSIGRPAGLAAAAAARAGAPARLVPLAPCARLGDQPEAIRGCGGFRLVSVSGQPSGGLLIVHSLRSSRALGVGLAALAAGSLSAFGRFRPGFPGRLGRSSSPMAFPGPAGRSGSPFRRGPLFLLAGDPLFAVWPDFRP